MIALWLIAAHMVGDFVLQDRWEAAAKLTDPELRARHVLKYAVPFVPVALVYQRSPWFRGEAGWENACLFLAGLIGLHYLTDSRRFTSTLGDVIAWRFMRRVMVPSDSPHVTRILDGRSVEMLTFTREPVHREMTTTGRIVEELDGFLIVDVDLLPNPWPPISIMVDQSLHLLQIAVLAAVFL